MLEYHLKLGRRDIGTEWDENGSNEVRCQEEGSAVDGSRVYEEDPVVRPDSHGSQDDRKASRMYGYVDCGQVQCQRFIDVEDDRRRRACMSFFAENVVPERLGG